MNKDSYLSVGFKDTIDINIDFCYLCDKSLDFNKTPDHIIPDKLFIKKDPHRPKLYVHKSCNNQKSKDDEWFMKHLQILSSFNKEAELEVSNMMDKAIDEKKDAYIIGKKLHNYKLARGMFDEIIWGLEFTHNGLDFQQMKLSKKTVDRFQKYIEKMCQGLFIRNVLNSRPAKPRILQGQYAYLELKKNDIAFINTVGNLVNMAGANKFGQRWGERISYIGSRVTETPNKGFIFIQFYSQYGILSFFQ